MIDTLTIIHAIGSVLLIIFVLIQFGKGAEAGLFSQESGSAFSSSQQGNILTKITTVLVVIFLGLAVVLSSMRAKVSSGSYFDDEAATEQTVPLNSDSTAPSTPEAIPAEAAPAAPGKTEQK